jgi:alpha/beta superfamily hydrolase
MAPDFLREIAGPAGPLEALLDVPEGEPRAVAVFGHPHPLQGGTMHTKALYQAAKAMPRIGVAALRFNFRGVGRSGGTFDSGPGEKEDFKAAIDFVSDRFPDLPVWAAGMSFGSWIAMTTGAEDPRVSLLLAIAPPVDRYEFDALRTCTLPKFIIHGEGRRIDFDQGDSQVLLADPGAERARHDRIRESPVRGQDAAGR